MLGVHSVCLMCTQCAWWKVCVPSGSCWLESFALKELFVPFVSSLCLVDAGCARFELGVPIGNWVCQVGAACA